MKTLSTPIEELYSVEHNESMNNTTQTKFVIPFYRTTVGLSLISHPAFKLWNGILLPIKKINSLKKFYKDFQKHLLNQLKRYVSVSKFKCNLG